MTEPTDLAAEDAARTGVDDAADAAVHPGPDDRSGDRPGRQPGELVVAMSPQQILGGFALLAALVVMLRRRSRRRGRG